MKKLNTKTFIGAVIVSSLLLGACESAPPVSFDDSDPLNTVSVTDDKNPGADTPGNVENTPDPNKTYRDSTPVFLMCEAPGTLTDGNEYVTIDYSNHK